MMVETEREQKKQHNMLIVAYCLDHWMNKYEDKKNGKNFNKRKIID